MLTSFINMIQLPLRSLSFSADYLFKFKIFSDSLNMNKESFKSSFFYFIDHLRSFASQLLLTEDYNKNVQNSKSHVKICWYCKVEGEPINSFFCKECGTIQEIYDINYLDLYGINGFKVNHEQLAKRARELRVLIDPAKFQHKNIEEYNLAIEWDRLLKSAYYTLCSCLKRGQYILQRKGFQIASNCECLHDDFSNYWDLLITNWDLVNNKGELYLLNVKVRNVIEDQIRETEKSFDKEDFETAEKDLLKLQYLYNIYNRINQIVK